MGDVLQRLDQKRGVARNFGSQASGHCSRGTRWGYGRSPSRCGVYEQYSRRSNFDTTLHFKHATRRNLSVSNVCASEHTLPTPSPWRESRKRTNIESGTRRGQVDKCHVRGILGPCGQGRGQLLHFCRRGGERVAPSFATSHGILPPTITLQRPLVQQPRLISYLRSMLGPRHTWGSLVCTFSCGVMAGISPLLEAEGDVEVSRDVQGFLCSCGNTSGTGRAGAHHHTLRFFRHPLSETATP